MNVKINNEEELIELAKEAIHIMNNLRYSTKQWNMHYGSRWKERKSYWEEKADLFLERLRIKNESTRSQEIKIKIDATKNTTPKD